MTSAVDLYGAILAAVLATAAIARALARADSKLRRLLSVVERMADLLQPADGTPGLVQRMRDIEARTVRIEAELRPNGGGSTRDAIARVETGLDTLNRRL